MRIKKGQQDFLLALFIFAPCRRRGSNGRGAPTSRRKSATHGSPTTITCAGGVPRTSRLEARVSLWPRRKGRSLVGRRRPPPPAPTANERAASSNGSCPFSMRLALKRKIFSNKCQPTAAGVDYEDEYR